MRNFLILVLLPFTLTLILQMLLCFKIPKSVWKGLPLVIDLLAFFYAGARFLGIISYASDITGIYTSGLLAGIFIAIIAFTGLIGIVFAWLIYYFIGWRKTRSTRS